MRFARLAVLGLACCNNPPTINPPVIACGTDASSCSPFSDEAGSDVCDGSSPFQPHETCSPPPVCADHHWSASFENGTCGSDGKCQLATTYEYCSNGCIEGQCQFY